MCGRRPLDGDLEAGLSFGKGGGDRTASAGVEIHVEATQVADDASVGLSLASSCWYILATAAVAVRGYKI